MNAKMDLLWFSKIQILLRQLIVHEKRLFWEGGLYDEISKVSIL